MDETNLKAESAPVPGSPNQSGGEVPSAVLFPAQRHPMHDFFIGPRGLRPGWRLLLYLVLWRVCVFLVDGLTSVVVSRGIHGIWLDLTVETKRMVAVLLPAAVMGLIEKRPFGAYGLPGRQAFGKLFWTGVVWGIAAVSLLVFAIEGVGDFSLGMVALHGIRVLKFAMFWGGFFLIVGFFEEFLLRGYSQFTLSTGIGFWPAAVLLSFIFAALHYFNPGETFIGLVAVAAIGLFFCLTLRRTGSLWFAVGFHASFDWGESYLYSVPDSGTTITGHLLNSSFQGSRWFTGGTVGPEGSVFVFVVIAVLWVVFDRMYPKANYALD
jgi:membrane protease YdiL (CAAX protease family)